MQTPSSFSSESPDTECIYTMGRLYGRFVSISAAMFLLCTIGIVSLSIAQREISAVVWIFLTGTLVYLLQLRVSFELRLEQGRLA